MLTFPFLSECQIYIGFSEPDSTIVKDSSNVASGKTIAKPDADQGDNPFIDYKPAVIWNTPTDSIHDYCYIRRNFTDQMVSVWNHPNRLYPASHIYALEMDGKYYRTARTSPENYVFAERVVSGQMNLYLYRKIPQYEGWVEFVVHDSLQSGYRNNMIIENENSKGKRENFGYFISKSDNVLVAVSASKMKMFADTFLVNTPQAYAKAMKFANQKMTKSKKIAVISLMSLGIIGLAATGGTAASYIFLAGFPAAAFVAFANKPHTLHWQDMVEIVDTYNLEMSEKHP
jgi:hypothetical protein